MKEKSNQEATSSKVKLWTGRVLRVVCILFLLFDSLTKVVRATASVEGTANLGFSDSLVQPLGFIILAFTILYCIPRTAVFGAVLLTAHLGGAVAIFIQQFHDSLGFLFPLIFCVVLWAGLFLQDERLRSIVPVRKREI